MTKSLEIPMFKPRSRPRFKKEGSSVVAYYQDDLSSMRQAVADQWTDAPLSGKVALEAEFRVPLPKRCSKARRAAMIAGEIAPPSALTVDDLLRGVLDCLPGVVVEEERQVAFLSGSVCYSETAGATVRVGEANFYCLGA